MRGWSIKAWLAAAGVWIAAAGVVFALTRSHELPGAGVLLGFGVLFLLAELAPITFAHGSYSVSYVLVIASLIAVGPAAAAIAAAFTALDMSVRHRPDWLGRMLFNGAQFALSSALAGAVYVALGGPIGSLNAGNFATLLLPLVVASLVFFVANTLLVSIMVVLVRGVPFREVWSVNVGSVIGSTFAFGVLGVLLSSLYLQMGFPAVVFVLVPLLVARRALQAAAEMDDAYEATVRALVTAIEAKDAYTRGHAERVSRLSVMVARELGLSEPKVRVLRHAALMHDVGKLVVSHAVLTKPGKLTEEEFEHMKAHPEFGVEVIQEVDFLRGGEAINAVRHHHERLDGRGYPDGLFGDEIPLTARIVMVADAFDSMTSTRSYRPAMMVEKALNELRRCSATQFDPMCVNALDRAIKRNGWEPSPEAFLGEQTPRPAVDVQAANK